MGLDVVLQVLSGSSDIALVAIAWSIWKLDRRVLRLELTIEKGRKTHV